MEFRDYAAKETSGLFGRLLTSRTEASLERLRSLRDALDAAAREMESEAGDPQAEQDVQELIRRLNTAAGTAARAASQKVQKEAQTIIDAVNEDLKAQRLENERLVAASAEGLARAEAQAEALRADLQKETDRADAADRDLDAAIEAHAQVDAARVEAESACRQQMQARTAAEQELVDARGLLERTVAEASQLSGDLDAARAETADLQASLIRARAELEQAREEARTALQAVELALDAERERSEQLASSLAGAQAQADMLQADLVDVRAQMETLRADLSRETERAAALESDLDAAIEAHALVDAGRLEAEAATRAQAQGRAAVEEQLTDLRAQLDAAIAEATRVGGQLDANRADTSTLRADLTTALAELDVARTEREAVAAELDATRAHVLVLERNQAAQEENLQRFENDLNDALHAAASATELAAGYEADSARAHADMAALRSSVDRLGSLFDASMQSIDELASTTSVTELLASLVRQLSVEFARVALFRVKGNRLEGEYQMGFDETTDVTKLVLPLSLDSLITRAASSGVIEHLEGSELDEGSRAPFGGSPSAAFALPVAFQGEAYAVVYADSDQPEREPGAYDAAAGFAKLMVQTAAVLMTRLSQELKTLNELSEYAAMLLQEAEEMFSADLQAGKTDDERRSRLKDTVECARQLYAQRASLEGPAAATLLDDRIAAAIEADPVTEFARDLAALVGSTDRLADSRRTAAS
jgi:hypothetical protein